MASSFDIVVYHAGCPDGLSSAWIAKQHLPKALFWAAKHSQEVCPDMTGKNVLCVDFAYTVEQTADLFANKGLKSMTVLDHHLSSLPLRKLKGCDLKVIHDIDLSGCQITWTFFNPDKERPVIFDYIADRDLWKWELPESKAVSEGTFRTGWFDSLDSFDKKMNAFLKGELPLAQIIENGKAFLELNAHTHALVYNTAVLCTFKTPNGQTHPVYVVDCDKLYTSEVGSKLALLPECDFVLLWIYSHEKDEWWVSARSRKDSPYDLNVISNQFQKGDMKGGGHRNAAGFTLYGGSLRDFLTPIQPVKPIPVPEAPKMTETVLKAVEKTASFIANRARRTETGMGLYTCDEFHAPYVERILASAHYASAEPVYRKIYRIQYDILKDIWVNK
jgi:oligoribonuclease NrnB/cAMP/cGMP phosphodiesterase (DHH superfamily)